MISIAPSFTTLPSASIANDGTNMAGYETNYILTFKNGYFYNTGTWFRINFPTGFTFDPALSCYIVSP
jgi:hypothetical protein